jgi:hypothetical protein
MDKTHQVASITEEEARVHLETPCHHPTGYQNTKENNSHTNLGICAETKKMSLGASISFSKEDGNQIIQWSNLCSTILYRSNKGYL